MRLIACSILIVLLHQISPLWTWIDSAHAGTPIHGAKAAAMQAAFVAVADDPSAIVHNPAGITHLNGTHIYTGVTAVMGSTEFKDPAGRTEESDFKVYFPPHAYVTSDFNSKNMAFGLGLYSPFGIGGRQWSEEGLTRYLATKNLISTLALNPVFACKVLPHVSIGAGAFYIHATNESERMIDQSALGFSDGKFALKGKGGGFGYNLAVLLFPGREISFGMAYRSKTDVDQEVDIRLIDLAPALHPLTGGSSADFNADATLRFPESLNFGLACRSSRFLTLSVELEWIRWSRFDSMEVDLRHELPEAGITDFTVRFDYKDTWLYKIGADYEMNPNISIRAGYAYIENPVPNQTLSPANPDADQHSMSIGLGYKRNQWHLDFFYMYEIFKRRSVANEAVTGEFRTSAHFAGLSFGYTF